MGAAEEIAKNPTNAELVLAYAESCLGTAEFERLRQGLDPAVLAAQGLIAVRPIAVAVAKALTKTAERTRVPRDAVEFHLRAARLLAHGAGDRLGAAHSLAAAWRLMPDERVALQAQVLFPGTAEPPEYTLTALANVGGEPNRTRALRRLAALALERRQVGRAEELFQQLAGLHPDDRDASSGLETLAELRARADARAESARRALKRAKSAGERAEALHALGDALRGGGQFAEAVEAYRQALTQGDEGALGPLEAIFRERDQVAEFRPMLEALLPEVPTAQRLAIRRRLFHLVQGEAGKPGEAEQVLRWVPPAPDAGQTESRRVELARHIEAAIDAGHTQEAAARLEELASWSESAPERLALLERAATLVAEAGGEAEPSWRKVRALDPQSLPALAFYRTFYAEHPDPRRALHNLQQLHTLEADLATRRALATEMAVLAEDGLRSPERSIEAWHLVERDLDLVGAERDGDQTRVWGELKRLHAEAGQWHAYVDLLERWYARLAASEEAGGQETAAERIELLFEIVGVYQDPDRLPMPAMVLATYQRIVQLAPAHRVALDQLAAGLAAREQWVDLLPVLARKVEIASEPAELVGLFHQIAELYLDRIRSETQAIPVLEQILQLTPDDLGIVQKLREIYRRRHDSELLHATLMRELELSTKVVDRVRILEDLATLAEIQLLQPEDAIKHWQALLALEPAHAAALEALLRLHAAEEDWPAYVTVLEKRVTEAKTKAARLPLMLELGEAVLTRLGDMDRAEQIFQAIAETSPTSAVARRFLQRIFAQRRKWRELERLFARPAAKGAPAPSPTAKWKEYVALLRDATRQETDGPLLADLHAEIARVLEVELGDRRGATEHLEQAVRAQEDRVDLAERALPLLPEDTPAARRMPILTTLARFASEPTARLAAWMELGQLHRKAKDPLRAVEAWGKALSIGAELGRLEALSELEEDAGATGHWEAAWTALDEALGRVPADTGEPAEAAADGEAATPRAVRPTETRITLHRALGHIARARLLRPDEAIRHFKWVLQLAPGDAFALEELEKVHFSRNDFMGLESVFRARAAAMEPAERAEALLKLARLFDDVLIDPDRAAGVYLEVLANAPDNAEAQAGLVRGLEASQAWADLAQVLEGHLARERDPAARRSFRTRLAEIYGDRLADPLAAIEHARAQFEDPGSALETEVRPMLALVERLAKLQAGGEAAPALELAYRRVGALDRLAAALEAQIERPPLGQTPSARAALRDEIALIAEGVLGDAGRAFTTLVARFAESPDEPEVWTALERLAGRLGRWEELAEAYRAVLGTEGALAKSARGMLRLRLSDIFHRRLIELEDAVNEAEKALEELDDEQEILRAYGELEILYKKTADLDRYVAAKLGAAQRVISRALRRQKTIEAAQALAGALGQPAKAAEVLSVVWAEDPGDPETFEQMALFLDKVGNAADLDDAYDRAIASARDEALRDHWAYRRAIVRRDKLGRWEDAINDLLGLTRSPTTGQGARAALLEVARAQESAGQREVILEALTEFFREARDAEGLVQTLVVAAEFAEPGGAKAATLSEAATICAGRGTEDGTEPVQQALNLWAQALVEVPEDEGVIAEMRAAAEQHGLWSELADAWHTCAEIAGESADHALAARLLWRSLAEVLEARLDDPERAAAAWEDELALSDAHELGEVDDALAALDRLYRRTSNRDGRRRILERRAESEDPVARAAAIESLGLLVLEGEPTEAALAEATDELIRALELLRDVPRVGEAEEIRQRTLGTLDSLLSQQDRVSELVELTADWAVLVDDANERQRLRHRAAELADESGDALRATELYELLVADDPSDELALQRLALLHTEGERWDDSVRVLELQLAIAENQTDAGTGRPEAAAIAYEIGSHLVTRLGDPGGAVTSFTRALQAHAAHSESVMVLARIESDTELGPQYGRQAREALADAYRRRGETAPLAGVLERMAAQGEGWPGLERELAELWSGPLKNPQRAWVFAVRGYALDPTGVDGLACRAVLIGLGPQLAKTEGRAPLVNALVEVAHRISDPDARRNRRLDDLAVLEKLRPTEAELAPLWREILSDDPTRLDLATKLETYARHSGDRELLADALRSKRGLVQGAALTAIELELGSLYLAEAEHLEDAVDVYRAILVREPGRKEAFGPLDRVLRKLERYAERAELLEDMLAHEPRSTILRRELAELMWRQLGEPSRAVGLYSDLLEDDPSDLQSIEALEGIWNEGHERVAILRLLEPRYRGIEAWDKLAELYGAALELDDPEVQIESLTKLADLERNVLNRPDGAMTTLLALVQRTPHLPDGPMPWLEELESLAESLGRWGELAEILESTLVQNPELPMALWVRLGRMLDTQVDEPERAIRAYRAAATRAPEDREVRALLLELLERAESWDALERELVASSQATDDPLEELELRRRAAEILDARLGRGREAAFILQDVFASAPIASEVFRHAGEALAAALDRRGDRSGLEEHLRTWMARAPDEGEQRRVQVMLGKALVGYAASARDGLTEIEEVLRAEPGRADALQALWSLIEACDAIDDDESAVPEALADAAADAARVVDAQLAGKLSTEQQLRTTNALLRVLPNGEERQTGLLRAARLAAEAGEPEHAFGFLADALTALPGDTRVEAALEALAASGGDGTLTSELAALYERCADGAPEPADYVLRAARLVKSGEAAEWGPAAALYERILELQPGSREAADVLTQYYAAAGDPQSEVRVLEHWIAYAADASELRGLRLRAGTLRMDQLGDTQGATEALEGCLPSGAADPEIVRRLERLYARGHEYEALAALYAAALEHLPKSDDTAKEELEILAKAAQVYETRLGDLQAARNVCRRMLVLDTQNRFALTSLERIERALEDWEAVDAILDQKLKATPSDGARARVLIDRAELALQKRERPDEALEYLRQADRMVGAGAGPDELLRAFEALLRCEPTIRVQAARILGKRYRARQAWPNLVNALLIELTLASDDEERVALANQVADLAANRFEERTVALRVLAAALRQAPHAAQLREVAGGMARVLGAAAPETQALIKAGVDILKRLDEGPALVDFGVWLGTLERDFGDAAQAAKVLERVMEVDPRSVAAAEGLGGLYVTLGDAAALRGLFSERLALAAPADRPALELERALTLGVLENHDDALVRVVKTLAEAEAAGGADPHGFEAMLERRISDPRLGALAAAALVSYWRGREDAAGHAKDIRRALEARATAASDPAEQARNWSEAALVAERDQNDLTTARALTARAAAATPLDAATWRSYRRLAEQTGAWRELEDAVLAAMPGIAEPMMVRELTLALAEAQARGRSEFDRSIATLQGLVQQRPDDVDVRRALLRLHAARGDVGAFEAEANELADQLAQVGDTAGVRALWMELARLAESRGDTTRVVSAYEAILEEHPFDQEAGDRLAALHEHAGRYDDLAELLTLRIEAALENGGTLAEAARLWTQVARLREGPLDDAEGALAAWREAFSLAPEVPDAAKKLAAQAVARGDWQEASEVLAAQAAATETGATSAALWLEVGKLREEHLDAESATAAYEAAVSDDPGQLAALTALIALYAKGRKFNELAATIERKAGALPARAERHLALVQAAAVHLDQRRDPATARAVLEGILAEDAGQLEARLLYARLLAREGRPVEAADMLGALTPLLDGKRRVRVLMDLARLEAAELGRASEALAHLEEALALEPGAPGLEPLYLDLVGKAGDNARLVAYHAARIEGAKTAEDKAAHALAATRALIASEPKDPRITTWLELVRARGGDQPDLLILEVEAATARGDLRVAADKLRTALKGMEERRAFEEIVKRSHALGRIELQIGNVEAALAAFARSHELDGKFLPTLIDYGRGLVLAKRWSEALAIHQVLLLQRSAIADDAERQAVLERLALASWEAGQRERAKQYLQRLLSERPDHAGALALKARFDKPA